MLAIEGERVSGVRVADELQVGLVDEDENVRGHSREERRKLVVMDDRTGRVVRRADENRTRPIGDPLRHGVEVEPGIRGQWHLDPGGAGHLCGDRVRLERAPGVDHLVAGLADRVQQVVEEGDRAGADGQVARRNPQPLGELRHQSSGGQVGVAVDRLRRSTNGVDQLGRRRERVLVAGELVRRPPRRRRRRTAWLVRRDALEGASQARSRCGHGFTLGLPRNREVTRRRGGPYHNHRPPKPSPPRRWLGQAKCRARA